MPDHPFRVAYLSYDGLTDPLGQSQILPYILGLEEKGFEFTIFSFEKPDVFATGKSLIDSAIDGKKIVWNPLQYHKTPPVLSTLLDIFVLNRSVSKAHRERPFHLIHCRSYITSLVGLRMKRKAGIKFLFDMRGFWADERVEGGLWELRNPVYNLTYKFFKRREKQFLKEADHIVSLTENAKQEILSWQLKTAPITVIPTCVDLDLFNPEKIKKEDQDKVRAVLGIKPDDFVLLYLGSWGTWYLTKEMLEFFSEIKKQTKQARFLIVTGDKVDLGYPDKPDVIVTSVERDLVPIHISLANASVCLIKPSFSKKASSATKLGEILAMNVPVFTNKGWGDVERFNQSAHKVIYFDLEEFFEMKKIGKNSFGRAFVVQHLSLEKGVQDYRAIYNSVCSS